MYLAACNALKSQDMEGLYDTAQIAGEPQPQPPPGR
jgi:hypothetical protein